MLASLALPVNVFAEDVGIEEVCGEDPCAESGNEKECIEAVDDPEDIVGVVEGETDVAAGTDEGGDEAAADASGAENVSTDDDDENDGAAEDDEIILVASDEEYIDEAVFEDGPYQICQDLIDVSAAAGETVVMKIVAPGTTSYRWQYRLNPNSAWNDFTNNSGTFTFTMAERYANRQYRVFVSNGKSTLESRTITLTLEEQSDFVFSVSGNAATLTKYNGTDSAVVVPATYKDLPVKAIGESAFEGNTTITSVSLPNSVEVIGAKAFKNCSNLNQMTCYG